MLAQAPGWRRRGLCVLAMAAWAVVAPAACGLTTAGGENAPACKSVADCDDGNRCSTDRCDEASGICQSKPAPDGEPVAQTPGDCQIVQCSGGLEVGTPDDADADDHDPCTADACSGGVPSHDPLADGASCKLGESDGQCVEGKCVVACNATTECDDAEPCTVDSCDLGAGVCAFQPLHGDKTPGAPDLPDDCVFHVCVGGQSTTVADDLEIPDDGNPCTADTCVGGQAEHYLMVGEPCPGGYCGPRATCVECVESAQCPPGKTCGGGGEPHVCGCTPSACCNGAEDGAETDVDCGGGTCEKCDLGEGCLSDADCQSDKCNTGQGECQ